MIAGREPLPWRLLVLFALVGTAILVLATPRALEAGDQDPASRSTTGAMASSASRPSPIELMP